eukprot:TRINITY_DN8920_c0_g1_i1.p1 TRINITY_DN8920_c0_g1~~TRINITY_DN8920_c0_g1_i1.p1  ORF type:complete len:115 (+),score=3.82 TRINITY_DN8920_c0_g1_i1:445-789(+)
MNRDECLYNKATFSDETKAIAHMNPDREFSASWQRSRVRREYTGRSGNFPLLTRPTSYMQAITGPSFHTREGVPLDQLGPFFLWDQDTSIGHLGYVLIGNVTFTVLSFLFYITI